MIYTEQARARDKRILYARSAITELMVNHDLSSIEWLRVFQQLTEFVIVDALRQETNEAENNHE